jgi:hypothetical protein
MKNTEKYKATIMLNKNDWEIFKELCKLNESDASKELRKYIKNYIVENSDKVAELLKKGGQK